MAYFATSSDAVQLGGALGNIHRNAPVVIVRFLGLFSILAIFMVTIFIAGAVLRDTEIGISEMIFATPMKKRDYLFGRFLAGFVACLSIFVLISFGIGMGSFGSSFDPARFGPFSLMSYLFAFAVIVVPNLLFMSALLMLLAALTRSILQVYVGVVVLLTLSGVAGQFAAHLDHNWAAALLDPFGLSAVAQMVKYNTIVESNTQLPSLTGYLLVNRLVWLAVTALLFLATVQFFKPNRAGTGRSWFKRAAKPLPLAAPSAPLLVKPIAPNFTSGTGWTQCFRILAFDTWSILRSAPFLVMLLLGPGQPACLGGCRQRRARFAPVSGDSPDAAGYRRGIQLHAGGDCCFLWRRTGLQGTPGQDIRCDGCLAGAQLGASCRALSVAGGCGAVLHVSRHRHHDGLPAGQRGRRPATTAVCGRRIDRRGAVHPAGSSGHLISGAH